jgi:outer membrane protein OmpA-like peptidoglycan-associated protein
MFHNNRSLSMTTQVLSPSSRMFPRAGVVAAALALTLVGCANMTESQKGTAVGAGVGAGVGALVGKGKGAAIGAGVGALGGYIWSNHMQKKKAEMEQATAGTGVAVTQTADNQLKLEIPADISFDTGRADIRPSLRPILDQFANGLRDQPNTEVRIIGHTDSTGSDAVNDPLSLQRANSARDYLSVRGVDSRRILTAGRGSREPIAENNSEAGRAKNRRVEIYLAERHV